MIIGIAGKMQVGKDTVAAIIRALDWYNNGHKINIRNDYTDVEYTSKVLNNKINCFSEWKVVKFADKLKDITCLILGCTREQLEDIEFKNKILGQEWWYYKVFTVSSDSKYILYPYLGNIGNWHSTTLIKMTPRLFMQLLGTDAGRNILHPDIWVNSTMNGYTQQLKLSDDLLDINKEVKDSIQYPNWIISDVRFPNEAKAIKDKEEFL